MAVDRPSRPGSASGCREARPAPVVSLREGVGASSACREARGVRVAIRSNGCPSRRVSMVDAGCTYLWPVRVHVRASGRGSRANARSERSLRGRAGTNLGIASRTGTPSCTRSSREGRSSMSTHGARNRSRGERVRRDSRWHHRRTRAPASMASREVDEGNTAKGVPAWGAWALTQPTGQAPGGLRSTETSCSSRRRRSGRTALEPVGRAAGRDEGRPRSVVSGKGSSSSRGRGGSKHGGQTSRETAPATKCIGSIITRDGTCEQRVHPPLLPSERELAGAV